MKQETRIFALNLRADDAKEFALSGVAASYDCLSEDLGGFKERIARGAFSRSLKDNDDVVCLLNHDQNHVLGRVKSGTLNLFDTAKGLSFKVMLDPESANHRDIYQMVKRGDINQCSFAFTVPDGGDAWDEASDASTGHKFVRRTLLRVDLRDVSVVTRPAYAADGATSVAARSVYSSRQILSSQAKRQPSTPPPLSASPAAVDDYHRLRAQEIADEIWYDETIKPRIEAVNRAMANERAAEIAEENERNSDAGLQRRIEAANRAVAADRAKGEI
jgi:Escherichia/Staphylococcus phage prohead protease